MCRAAAACRSASPGLVQSGGFGSFSKAWGLAAANLLEAEVVTADGAVRIANACSHPDLFWGLKGGGGGSLGVVTRLTLRVHPLPEDFGAVNMTINAASPAAFRRLVGATLDFCAASLLNPHWGEQIRFRPDNVVKIAMVFQGLSRSQAQAVWRPFMDAARRRARLEGRVLAAEDRLDLGANLLVADAGQEVLGFIKSDDRPGAPETNVFWPGDQGQAGQFLHGYDSAWLPAALLRPGAARRARRHAVRREPAPRRSRCT